MSDDAPDHHEYVTLDCGCIVEIDCNDNWEYSFDGEQETGIKTSDSLDGGRITKTCSTHKTANKEN